MRASLFGEDSMDVFLNEFREKFNIFSGETGGECDILNINSRGSCHLCFIFSSFQI